MEITEESVTPVTLPLEEVALDRLRAHPRNYQVHPDDEILHLMESIRSNGVYKNVVVANDGRTLLAGHGVWEAAQRLHLPSLSVRRMPFGPEDPRALKLLAGDNEISHLAEVDDRALTELLREVKEADLPLLGTGYDEMMLANLVMVTRPESEIEDLDAAAHWVGLPEYAEGESEIEIVVHFATEEDCQAFCRLSGLERAKLAVRGARRSYRWPPREPDDVTSLNFVSGGTHDA